MTTFRIHIVYLGVLLLFFALTPEGQAQSGRKLKALRTDQPIKIDGKMLEPAWNQTDFATGFIQNSPNPGKPSSFRTEVRILYDNTSLYVAARMFDVSPDSIWKEFTGRDQYGMSDVFGIYLDTYDNDQDAFLFVVTAAGVQLDARVTGTRRSYNWNAAWKSEVTTVGNDWYVEMEIPYSAIRFPKSDVQTWGVNFYRSIRRLNERAYWSEVNPEVNGLINQFGTLEGLKDIKSPLRLQVSPYMSGYVNHYSRKEAGVKNMSQSVNYGMDLKYGISDAFTLDMILIPDFGQVLSDNQVLNLSPFEVFFDENRQFFIEGTELFNRANLFYSRRVGGRPIHAGRVASQLQEGETIVRNPQESTLLNASKISGRTKKGFGLGIFNAVTNEMFATVRNEQGEERKVQTAPLVNYNIITVDQTLKNNSYVALINTNVTRQGDAYDANVTGVDFNLVNKANAYGVSGQMALSNKYGGEEFANGTETGFKSSLTLGKVGGKFRWSYTNYVESDTYDPNDMGFMRANNEFRNTLHAGYYVFKPFGKFIRFSSNLNVTHEQLYQPFVFTGFSMSANTNATFTNFYNAGLSVYLRPVESFDYFEPRVQGRFFTVPPSRSLSYWMSTDGRKKLALSASMGLGSADFFENSWYHLGFSPRFRVNDKLTFSSSINASTNKDNVGYVSRVSDEQIHFGLRDINTLTNIWTTKYTFNNKMDFFVRMRHYWSTAQHKDFFELEPNGRLAETDYQAVHDRNFTSFNIDMVYTWVFAPASEVSVVWKNAILTDEASVQPGFGRNFAHTFEAPQLNSISVRVLYLLDYSMLMKNRRNNRMVLDNMMASNVF
jgi:hypothetical protein